MSIPPPGTAVLAGRSSVGDVCEVLWPAPATVQWPVPAGAARSRGAQPEREFIVLPLARQPRLLVPAGRRAGAAAVRRYGEPGSFTAWAGSRILALALAGGAGAIGLGGRLRVRPGPGSLDAYLSQALGRDVLISTHLGAARANRKLVLQLLTPDGGTAGFAKLSVNPLTRDLVRAERAALDTLAGSGLRQLTVPRVLHHGQWQGHDVLILQALSVWRRRRPLRPGRLLAAMAELAAVGGHPDGQVAASGFGDRLRSRLGASPDGPDRDALTAAASQLASALPELRFGSWHGDWTGWNMACTPDGLLVWDWERFARPVPLGFDALHYRLQSAVVRRHQPPAEAADDCVRAAPAELAGFGVPAAAARLTAVAYLTELSVRYLADRQGEAGARLGQPGRWLIPAIEKAMRTL